MKVHTHTHAHKRIHTRTSNLSSLSWSAVQKFAFDAQVSTRNWFISNVASFNYVREKMYTWESILDSLSCLFSLYLRDTASYSTFKVRWEPEHTRQKMGCRGWYHISMRDTFLRAKTRVRTWDEYNIPEVSTYDSKYDWRGPAQCVVLQASQ
jgi:hypothetical protein